MSGYQGGRGGMSPHSGVGTSICGWLRRYGICPCLSYAIASSYVGRKIKMQLDVDVSPPAYIIKMKTPACRTSRESMGYKTPHTTLTFLYCPNDFLSSDFLSRVNFGQVTDIQTESDAYEPTVHTHRWAQKLQKLTNF